jgi:hypothetical protein
MIIYFDCFTIRRYVNIDKVKIQRKLKVHEILLDIYFQPNLLLVYKWKIKIVENVLCDFGVCPD